MKSYSLRRSVLLAFVPPLLASIAIILATSLLSAHAEIKRSNDLEMTRLADMLVILTRHEALEGEDVAITLGTPEQQRQVMSSQQLAFRIWGSGNIILTSGDGSLTAFPAHFGPEGFATYRNAEGRWRILTHAYPQDDIVVEVSQNLAERDRLAAGMANSLLWPVVVLLPTVVVVVLVALNIVLRPMRLLSQEINARGAGNLEAVIPARVPNEIVSLVQALNSLLLRLKDSLNREREFTDNAAHELRTPLAALKTRTQVLDREIGPGGAGRRSVDELLTIVNGTTNLVDQLVTLARRRTAAAAQTSLSDVAAKLVAEMTADGAGKDHDFHADIKPGISVAADEAILQVLVRNLLSNALRHTPTGTRVEVAVRQRDGHAELTVSDTGPGIPSDDRKRVLKRFVRLNSTYEGSGLGLSIVADACKQISATLDLSSNTPSGLIATVRFADNDAPATTGL